MSYRDLINMSYRDQRIGIRDKVIEGHLASYCKGKEVCYVTIVRML